MGGIGVFHWVMVLGVIAVFAVPISKILRRAGYSGWWTIAFFVPLVNLIALWVFAFSDWPVERHSARPG
jgi:hypothetical protein